MFSETIKLIFIFSLSIQFIFIFYFFFSLKLYLSKSKRKINNNANAYIKLPVSVVICAKNESGNIKKHLPKVLEQDYKDAKGKLMYEVIVVNDHSSDNSLLVLQEIQKKYAHLIIVDLGDKAGGKKNALREGVAASKYECLLFTDADCMPAANTWIRNMAGPFEEGKEIIAGYGAYVTKNTFLNKWIRCETVHTFLQYFVYNAAKHPYMAVGRNLACTKAIFFKAEQNPLYYALPYGDDDLLVSTCANRSNMEVLMEPDSFTYSEAKESWKSWFEQKQRHLSTGKYYKIKIKMLLGLYALSHAVSWLTFFILLFYPFMLLKFVLILMLAKMLTFSFVLNNMAALLNEKKIAMAFFMFDLGWMIYNFAFAPYIFWKNKKQWK